MKTKARYVRNTGLWALMAFLALPAFATDDRPKMEWGEVSREQLQMTSFPADSNATAVVLFDHGEAEFNSGYEMEFVRHTRIKILSKAGFRWGTVVLTYSAGEDGERVSEIEGLTTTLGPDGRVVQQEMDSDAIFKEKVNEKLRRIRFTLPSLAEGCVIEYRFKRSSENPHYLPDWDFQTTEPVLWSEYRASIPDIFRYAFVLQGRGGYAIEESRSEKQNFLGPRGYSMVEMQIFHYAKSNVPALREEPYITTLDDYRERIQSQLSAYCWPGERPKLVFESWSKLVTDLLSFKWFGGRLEPTKTAKTLARALTDSVPDPLRKAVAIYDHVRKAIVWNADREMGWDRSVDDLLETRQGSSLEINFLLITLLREAGIPSTPVLVSTRSHGTIVKVWPIYANFDYAIARAKVAGTTLLLDATDRLRPYTVLPTRALNHEGLLLDEGVETWVAIEPGMKSRDAAIAKVALLPNGALRGTIQKGFADYRAFEERTKLAGKKDEDYVKGLLRTETSGIAADSFALSGREDCEAMFQVDARITAPAYGQVLEDFLYFNPMLCERRMDNPFKQTTREFPVDFAYGMQSTYNLSLTLPDGYDIKDVPQSFSMVLPARGGSFTRTVAAQDRTIEMVVRVDLTQTVFDRSQYHDLRSMYEQIVAREAEQVVLVRRPPPPPVSPPMTTPAGRPGKRRK